MFFYIKLVPKVLKIDVFCAKINLRYSYSIFIRYFLKFHKGDRIMKKTLSLVLALVMVAVMLPVAAFTTSAVEVPYHYYEDIYCRTWI